MIRRAGRGRRPAAWAPHATITRRRCCPQARCWWREDTNGSWFLSSAELYDPATRDVEQRPAALAPHATRHTATLLPNGKVLVAGGSMVSVALEQRGAV